MNAPKTIRVTAEHIAQGWRGSACNCPIALALKDEWPGAEVEVSGPDIEVSADRLWLAQCDDTAMDFIVRFDAGADVQPFEFDVEWLDPDGVSFL